MKSLIESCVSDSSAIVLESELTIQPVCPTGVKILLTRTFCLSSAYRVIGPTCEMICERYLPGMVK